jgi:hypothetical protein
MTATKSHSETPSLSRRARRSDYPPKMKVKTMVVGKQEVVELADSNKAMITITSSARETPNIMINRRSGIIKTTTMPITTVKVGPILTEEVTNLIEIIIVSKEVATMIRMEEVLGILDIITIIISIMTIKNLVANKATSHNSNKIFLEEHSLTTGP